LGNIQEESNILSRFLSITHPYARIRIMLWIGDIFSGQQTISEEVTLRAHHLWDEYWARLGELDVNKYPQKWASDSWINFRRFSSDWWLKQFENYVNSTDSPQPTNDAIEQLVDLVYTHSDRVVKLLNIIVLNKKIYWQIRETLPLIKSVIEMRD